MKTGAEKSSTTSSSTATRAVSRPFVARAGEGDFFAPARRAAGPSVQMKMTVNQPGDKFEQEADKMADKVVRMPAPAAAREEKLQRQPEEKLRRKEEEKILKAALPEEKVQKAADDRLQKAPAAEEKLQRKGVESGGSAAVGGDVQSAIRNKTTGGEPLAADVRGHMEPRFNADFGNIRVHRDSESAALNNQLSARAFTYQNHIFFSRNQYQPGSSDGKQLLAHELTHTIQQGHAVQRAPEALPPNRSEALAGAIQRASAPVAAPVPMSSEAVNISSNVFNPSQRVKDEIEARGSKGLEVRVIVPGLTAEGRIKLRADSAKNYQSFTKGSMPLLNAWTQQLGGMHLNFAVRNSEIANGYASLKPGGGDTNDWLQSLQKNASLLGGLGLQVGHLPAPINKFDNGKLTLGVSNLKVQIGSFLDALFNLSIEDMSQPRIDATADVDIKGMAKGQLKLNNDAGKLTGQVSLAVSYKSFSGEGNVKYNADGSVDAGGKAAYNADKLSGEIQFVSTDIETANSFTKNAIAAAGGKENVQDAGPPAPVPVPKEGQKKRALAATGQLGFNLTKWFAGKVNVIVDGKGAITVIGRIAPPAEIELFKQKDWDKEIINFEAKAYYGLPVIGNLNLFANISLHALAKLGPAKIYNIEILGTYSTDPEVQKSIQISGSINISAYGGLMLRAEGGAGVEIVSHDLKFGVGLHADVGVKAYADARPTIGYRDPGVFYISGTLEVAAQPVLGLGGDFFIALETPWWSPLSDDRWTWPLFSKEWPLGDPIGISAVVKDYELGSGKVPEIELKKPEFDPSKFMTNMVDRSLPDKSGGAGAGKGQFKEDGSVPKPTVPPAKPAPKVADTKPARKGAPPKAGKSATPDPAAAKDQESAKIFQNAAKLLEVLKSKGPLTAAALNQELAKIKVQVAGIDFAVQLTGSKWMVTPKTRGKTGKKLELNAQVEPGAAVSSDRVSIRITMNGTVHTIEAVAAGNAIRLFMETHREELGKKLAREAALWANSENPEIRANGQALAARLATVQQREQALSTTYAATQDHAMRHALAVAGVNEIGNSLVAIANEFGIVIENEAIPRATPFRAYPLNLGRATGAYVDPLSVQSLRPGGPRTQFAPGGTLRFPDKDKYVAGHLVADTFGGPIEPSNLSLISRKTNGRFSSRESSVRFALLGTKKIPEPRTVLSYKTSVTFVDNPAGAMESWMRDACAKRFPSARVDGIGQVIMTMLGKDSWNRTTIERHLGWKDIPLAFHDRIMWKAASLYLAKSFTIAIQTYAGRTVPGDSFDNHIDGMKPPEP